MSRILLALLFLSGALWGQASDGAKQAPAAPANAAVKASTAAPSPLAGASGAVKDVLNGDKAILQFARMRVRSDDIPVIDLSEQSSDFGSEISGIIGIRTLVQMKMTIDYRDGLVSLKVYDFRKARE